MTSDIQIVYHIYMTYSEVAQVVESTGFHVAVLPRQVADDGFPVLGDKLSLSKLNKAIRAIDLEVVQSGSGNYIREIPKVTESIQEQVMPVQLGYYEDEPFTIDHLGKHLLICGSTQQGKSTLTHLHLLDVLNKYDNVEIVLIGLTKREFKPDTHQLASLKYPIINTDDLADRYLSALSQEIEAREALGNVDDLNPIFVYIDEVWELTEDYPRLNDALSFIARKGARNHVYLVMNLHMPVSKSISRMITTNCLRVSFFHSDSVAYRTSLGQIPEGVLARGQFFMDYNGMKRITVENVDKQSLFARFSKYLGEARVETGEVPATSEESEAITIGKQVASENDGLFSVNKAMKLVGGRRGKAEKIRDALLLHGYIDESEPKVKMCYTFKEKE